MDDTERLKRGEAARRRVLGNEWVDRSAKNRNAFNAEWVDNITRSPWCDVWTRPHFDDRTRRVLVIGTMLSLGRWEEFKLHVRGGPDGRRLHRRRHQGDHPAAGQLLRRAGWKSRLPGGRGGAEGDWQAALNFAAANGRNRQRGSSAGARRQDAGAAR